MKNKKQSFIFKIDLDNFFGKSFNTGNYRDNQITSIQDYEESLLDNFESFGNYIDLEEYQKYYKLEEAEEYLIKKGYKQEEIDLFRPTLESDLSRALGDAKDASYQYEYSQKVYSAIQEAIEKHLADILEGIDYRILEDLTDKGFQSSKIDQDHIKIKISREQALKLLLDNFNKEDIKTDNDIEDYLAEYMALNSASSINYEYIDYYGTLGDSNEWLEYFKDYNEIEDEIDNYRKDEADKLNNIERASLELKPAIENISNYIDSYIKIEPAKTKIKRQINALKSVIKNAV